jgi:hypothetical protein
MQMAKQEYAEVSIDSSEVERVRRTWPFLPEVASPTSRGPFRRGYRHAKHRKGEEQFRRLAGLNTSLPASQLAVVQEHTCTISW